MSTTEFTGELLVTTDDPVAGRRESATGWAAVERLDEYAQFGPALRLAFKGMGQKRTWYLIVYDGSGRRFTVSRAGELLYDSGELFPAPAAAGAGA